MAPRAVAAAASAPGGRGRLKARVLHIFAVASPADKAGRLNVSDGLFGARITGLGSAPHFALDGADIGLAVAHGLLGERSDALPVGNALAALGFLIAVFVQAWRRRSNFAWAFALGWGTPIVLADPTCSAARKLTAIAEKL